MSKHIETSVLPATSSRRLTSVAASRTVFVAGLAAVTVSVFAFLVHQLLAWPPHEDETLALFVGRDSLVGVIEHVTQERGGAPLHFVFSWAVVHLGFGLTGLRTVSALFAVASLPVIGCLLERLSERRTALAATVLTGASWALLFHGVYGRMYSLFLFLSSLTFLLFLRALEGTGRSRWLAWSAAMVATVAAHPYGALVLAGQGAFVLLAHRRKARQAAVWFGVVLVVGIPFWLTDIVLAGRFDVGVSAGNGDRLGGPVSVATYLWHTVGDFTVGWTVALVPILAVAVIGVRALPRTTQLFSLAIAGVPVIAFLGARLGGSASPESRHLIFVLPLVSLAVAAGLVRLARDHTVVLAVAVVAVAGGELAWAAHRTPALFDGEPVERQVARAGAADWLARHSASDDILFGYHPLFLGAWERDDRFPRTVLPRADATLALRIFRSHATAGSHGVWVLDASDPDDLAGSLSIARRSPKPEAAFDVARYGPFLLIRTTAPVASAAEYLVRAEAVTRLAESLETRDSELTRSTIDRAKELLARDGDAQPAASSSRSSSSR